MKFSSRELKGKSSSKMSNQENENKPPLAAIEYSTNTNEGLPVPTQPRPPRNLQDLLRYSTEAANSLGETTAPTSFTPLDAEFEMQSREFLSQVVKSMTIDVVQELLKLIKIVQTVSTIPENGDTSDCEFALDNISELVDNLDYANDFQKIGGFCIFKPCLESSHSCLRWRGALLIAELVQNNPYCQSKVVETGLMPTLLKMVDSDKSDIVKIKALYAVSCLVRDNEEGLEEFGKCDGFIILLRALQTDVEKLNLKAAFFLSSLMHWKPEIKDDLVSLGYVEQLISQLSTLREMSKKRNEGEHPGSSEYILRAIYEIVQDHDNAQEIARNSELQFRNLLYNIVKNSEENDQYREENEYAKNIMQIVFESESNQEVER